MSKSTYSESDVSNDFISEPIKKKIKINEDDQQINEEDSSQDANSPAESLTSYKPQGYHPVYIGEKYANNKYQVLQKLGWGTFSTVWLVQNTKNNQFLAMKIQKSKKIYIETALDEIKLLKCLNQNQSSEEWTQIKNKNSYDSSHCIQLIDNFPHYGIHGLHICTVFDLYGPTILDAIQFYENSHRMMEINLVKNFTKQTLIGLIYIHEVCKIIHTDLKPENIMFKLDQQNQVKMAQYLAGSFEIPQSQKFLNKKYKKQNDSFEIQALQNQNHKLLQQNFMNIQNRKMTTMFFKQQFQQQGILLWNGVIPIDFRKNQEISLADFGNACWINAHYTDNIQTKEYRAPEVIIGAEYNEKCDIWSLGCIIFEMLTNNYLFCPEKGDRMSEDQDILRLMIETLGPFDQNFINKGNKSKRFFNKNGGLKHLETPLEPQTIKQILVREYQFNEDDAEGIQQFLVKLLEPNYEKRVSAREALNLKWLRE